MPPVLSGPRQYETLALPIGFNRLVNSHDCGRPYPVCEVARPFGKLADFRQLRLARMQSDR